MPAPAASILVCPTAFKGTLSAVAAAAAMAHGARAAVDATDDAAWAGLADSAESPGSAPPEVVAVPLSDGGNGLLDALEAADGGEIRAVRVPDPIGEWVSARYLVQPGRVVVETAEACGLHLVPPARRDPLLTTTAGVGALLRHAADALPGPHAELVVGLGGSATVDAGAGMAVALGWSLLDDDGDEILPSGSGLLRLARAVPPEAPPLPGRVRVLADVTSPLLGPQGAARVFGPQKGASPRDVPVLERALAQWAAVVAEATGVDVREIEGGGAAGGLGAAFAALLGAPPERGADWVLEAVGFDRLLEGAVAVVTGEGAWDGQSLAGKVTGEVVARARRAGVPVLVVAGRIDGPLPDGVTGVSGAGKGAVSPEAPGSGALDAADLARLVGEGLTGLLAGPGRR